jgi:hypothetical protein
MSRLLCLGPLVDRLKSSPSCFQDLKIRYHKRITVTAYWEPRGPKMEDAGRVMQYHHFLLHDWWCIELLVHELTIGNQQRLSRFPRRCYQCEVYDDRSSLSPVNSSASWLG